MARASGIPRVYALCLVAFLVLSRWFVAPAHLFYFDSANFALALENFNPALHQPQPPGYPLFVGLTRIIHLALEDPQQVMLVAGLAGGIAAVLCLLSLGMAMFDRTTGILAAALLASDPVFWFGGVTNEVRVFLALGMAAVCLLGWRALIAPALPGRLYALFAALGIAAGFRPIETWLLAPLALWVWFRTGCSAGRLVRATAALAATTLPWLVFTVWRSGGTAAFLRTVNSYAQILFHDSSALFGAQASGAGGMFLKALAWTLMGTAVWIWAVPFVVRRPFRRDWTGRAVFLSIAFFPPFVFAALVHVGDPDQALAGVTVLSLAGGAVLGRLLKTHSAATVYIAAALLVLAHTADFYHPRFHLAEAASYASVRNVDRMTTETIRAIQALRHDGPVTVVHYGSPVTFRQISYYFPDDYVDALPGSPVQPAPGEAASTYFRHRQVVVPVAAAGRIAPGSKRVICLAPGNIPESALPGWRRQGPVFVMEPIPESGVKLGVYRLIW